MNSHNITNESLALALMLVVVAILISHKEKLALEKDILWSVGRAIIQLIIVGYVLKYIFSVDDASLTLLMVLFICFNAAWNAQKRSKYIAKAFISSFIAITVGAGITLAVLILSGSIEFIPMQVIPIAGMIAGNAMVAVGLCYNNLGQRVISEQQQIQEKLIKFATRIPVFMYLTDYRERCLKDVITQLEPGLFKKVTGLSVEDFNMLCSLGVFNAPLMNDAIFKFKRYEDASLTYTGIDKHTNDEVGGWDTTIRKTQYEKLFYNQQSSMSEVDYSAYSRSSDAVENERTGQQRTAIKVERPKSTPIVQPESARSATPYSPISSAASNKTEIDLKTQLEALAVDSTVLHKKFGKGTVMKINKNEKFIHVKFTLGEKKFIFPDALLMGFLEVE